MLIHKQGIFLDEKVYDLVKDISEDYSRRGGSLCILDFTTSVSCSFATEDELLHHEQNWNEYCVLRRQEAVHFN